MLNDLSVMCFVVESNDCAEVFESGYATLVGVGRGRAGTYSVSGASLDSS
jgi:hypothetical protein